jgi:hypothetical protein
LIATSVNWPEWTAPSNSDFPTEVIWMGVVFAQAANKVTMLSARYCVDFVIPPPLPSCAARLNAKAHGEACVHADPVKRFVRCFSNVICSLWLKFLYLNVFHYFVMFVICSENWESICDCRCSD